MNHSWNDKDELIAFLLFKQNASTAMIDASAKVIGCSPDSLTMRIANFKSVASGSGGLEKASQRTRDTYSLFSKIR